MSPRGSSISLERTPCYGSCPVYSVTLGEDGSVDWHGEIFVDRLGSHTGHISEWAFERLIEFARAVGYFDWDAEYTETVTDCPGTRITITIEGGQRHSVYQEASDEPRGLWTLATLIDGVCATAEWDALHDTTAPL